MTKYIANAFSIQMLSCSECQLDIKELKSEDVPLTECVSAVGHADTAAVLGVECRRVSLVLTEGDELYVAQLVGGRLPEGSTTLPEGFSFKFYKITMKEKKC